MNNGLIIPEGQAFYTSLDTTDKKQKVLFFKAVSNPDEKLSDKINEDIYVQDVFFEIVQFTDEDTGEITNAPRIVLFSPDGKTYSCVSNGIFKSICRLVSIFGTPPWVDPMHIKILQKSSKVRKFLTIELLDD